MGLFGSALQQLGRDLWRQKLRTFLTAFGVIWGTVAVVLLLAFGHGMHQHLVRQSAGLGDRIVIAWPSRTSIPFEGLGKGRPIRMTEEDIKYLKRQVPGIAAISSEYQGNFKASFGDRTRAVDVSGASPAYGDMRNMIPQEGGRFLNPTDMIQRRRVVFVGDHLALDLFGEPNPVGREVMLHGSPFLVIGVLKPKDQDSSYSGRDYSKMVIPGTTFKALTGRRTISLFIYKAPQPDLNPALNAEVLRALGGRLRFSPKDREAITIWDTTEMFAFLDAFMLGFKVFLGIMGVLTLVVGGIGVSNIMNVVVEERTREIGIKMALGARGRSILAQFMLETVILTALGGVIGLGISFFICTVFPSGLTEFLGSPELSPGLASLTACILGLVGCLAGYFPARDASRLDPVKAMKV